MSGCDGSGSARSNGCGAPQCTGRCNRCAGSDRLPRAAPQKPASSAVWLDGGVVRWSGGLPMTTVAKINARRKTAGLPLIRFNIRRLAAEDIQDLRDAFAAMYEISETAVGDRRGFWALARGHGYDQDLCHNDNRVF